jgi:hypothetical protein
MGGETFNDFEAPTRAVHTSRIRIRIGGNYVESVADTDAYPANDQRPWESMTKQSHTTAEHRSKLVSKKVLSSQSSF